ncbi:hypothetical protein [Nocardioides sp. cx-173]|uniref:hypothetical protein n=1 Tax=Nocardioides sp. cx-173 TaxID=2898796 RepID=UPI001E446203|nr:hypothetical protein [Nocardioides sp. cx-173]MCD4525218.1 hypothetical protein [Nocardioides sp. cx-173]UGB40979.1 hypothetical protein LQ940_16575 [Nocardioides sp. cx-173]
MTTWRHAAGTGVVCLGLLTAGSLLQGWLPDREDDPGAEPHVRTGAVGEAIDLRTATVTVDEVFGTTTVERYGAAMVSPGLWVVVHYSVVPTEENASITFAELRDAEGRVWGTVGRNTNSCVESAPGLTAHCTVFMEVPPDALPTLRLRLARLSRDTRFDALAEIDLGLTATDAESFASAPPYAVPLPTLGDDEEPS